MPVPGSNVCKALRARRRGAGGLCDGQEPLPFQPLLNRSVWGRLPSGHPNKPMVSVG